jgi:hypothetical protein
MPTIEIISIDADKLGLNQNDFSVAIIEQNKLIGHRGLFNEFLKTHKGVMIHIGNPDFKTEKENGFFAGMILDFDFIDSDFKKAKKGLKTNTKNQWANQQFKFKISVDFFNEIVRIIETSILFSPRQLAFFYTDYQFGPEIASIEKSITLDCFIALHDSQGLKWNTLYMIEK